MSNAVWAGQLPRELERREAREVVAARGDLLQERRQLRPREVLQEAHDRAAHGVGTGLEERHERLEARAVVAALEDREARRADLGHRVDGRPDDPLDLGLRERLELVEEVLLLVLASPTCARAAGRRTPVPTEARAASLARVGRLHRARIVADAPRPAAERPRRAAPAGVTKSVRWPYAVRAARFQAAGRRPLCDNDLRSGTRSRHEPRVEGSGKP